MYCTTREITTPLRAGVLDNEERGGAKAERCVCLSMETSRRGLSKAAIFVVCLAGFGETRLLILILLLIGNSPQMACVLRVIYQVLSTTLLY